jgi:hypothetical protein
MCLPAVEARTDAPGRGREAADHRLVIHAEGSPELRNVGPRAVLQSASERRGVLTFSQHDKTQMC